MAELSTPTDTTNDSCCAPEAKATCCEPSAKAECCDASHGEGCGCGRSPTASSHKHSPTRG
jgi:arsenite methyltransferase